MSLGRLLLRCLPLIGLAACAERDTSWQLLYSPESLALNASGIRTEIRRGSCDGPVVFAADLPSPGEPPVLSPGGYGFFARASDSSCRWFASGCVDLDLPLADKDRIVVTLSPETETDRCSGRCNRGRCEDIVDGGTEPDGAMNPDASTDLLSAIEVSAGRAHTCARLRETDEVVCWGLNESLQLGAVTSAVEQLTPVRVEGLVETVALSTGGNVQPKDGHSCAIVGGGEVRCWGDNLLGQLGNATAGAPRSTPQMVAGITTARGIDAGRQHTCVVTTNSQVFCWGANEAGQAGQPNRTQSFASPMLVPNLGRSLQQIATGEAHSCVTLGEGTVRCWGDNRQGQLGNAAAGDSSSDAVTVEGLTNIASVALGNHFTCALSRDSVVRCWGRNWFGELGDPGFPTGPTPQVVALPDRPVAEVVGGDDFACARMVDGDVQCWGSNRWGALGRGDGAGTEEMPPGPVSGIAATDISAGDNHVCAVTTEGQVFCWGRGQQGRLGNGNTSDRAVPTLVAGFER